MGDGQEGPQEGHNSETQVCQILGRDLMCWVSVRQLHHGIYGSGMLLLLH